MSLTKNYNYTYTVKSRGKSAQFRDITGEDLEYLEWLFCREDQPNPTPLDKAELLSRLLVRGTNPYTWGVEPVSQCFYIIFDEIIKEEFVTKEDWLGALYAMQNQSFVGVETMEKQPMNKFLAMSSIHSQAVAQVKKSVQGVTEE